MSSPGGGSGFQLSSEASTAGIYYARDGSVQPPQLYTRVAFLPPAGTSGLATALSLEESWGVAGGVYLFLGAAISNETIFVAQLRTLLAAPSYQDAALLWIGEPNAPLPWPAAPIFASGRTASGGGLPAISSFALRNYGVVLDGGGTLTVDGDLPGFTLGGAGQHFTWDYGAARLPLGAQGIQVPLTGPSAGCLVFSLPVSAGGAAIDGMDVGLRFYYPGTGPAGLLASLRYPVFDTTTSGLGLTASVDPLAPLDGARTALAFPTGGVALASFYRTTLGYPVRLTPQAGSKLVFAPRLSSPSQGSAAPLTLVPYGSFAATVPESTAGTPDLLCGTSGTEYVGLAETAGSPPLLTFVPGSPAFAPDFDPESQPSVADRPGPRLSSLATTSWAAVTPPPQTGGGLVPTLTYYAQPEESLLYGPAEGSGGGAAHLPFFPVPAGELPALGSGAGTIPCPLAPYAGSGSGEQPYEYFEQFEARVLFQERRPAIYRATQTVGPGAAGAGTVEVATPQGLQATFSGDGSAWDTLILAQYAPGLTTSFQSITDPLRSALLSGRQFLVVSDPAALKPYFGGATSQIGIQDWEFSLDPAAWGAFGTLMVVKNNAKTLGELVEDTGSWTMPDAFNSSLAQARDRLRAIIRTAKEDLPNEPNLKYFVDTVVNGTWNGMIFLNCPITTLPAQLGDLAAGIDPAQFYAHHVGINQTPITVSGGALQMQSTSLFGLITYDAPLRGPGLAPAAYDFQVLSLKVLFRNSVIENFSSTVAVTLNTLFGAPATQQDSQTGNALVLNGVYQSHGGTQAYVFTEAVPTTFALNDAVLASVRITKAQFATTQPASGPGSTVTARFTFWGSLCFNALAWTDGGEASPFDVFGYEALSFSALGLEMSFPAATPTARTFRFDPSGMAFDASQSTVRETGLPGHFPAQISAFLFSAATPKPADMGYMALQTPLNAQPVGAPWFGLVFDLNLGTLGALAGSVGIVASLVVAWSPSAPGGTLPVFVGLKLPGSSGKSIGLQGVLALTLYSLQLVYAGGAFVLMLNGMTLSFMKKTLPPGGSFDFYLFGDPAGGTGSGSMGWYGAYVKDASGGQSGGGGSSPGPSRRRIAAPGRAARAALRAPAALLPPGEAAPPTVETSDSARSWPVEGEASQGSGPSSPS